MIRPRLLPALTVLAAAALAPLSSPATAAPDGTVEATVLLRDLTLPAGGPTLDEYLAVSLTSGRAGWANAVTLSIDTSAATTVADVSVTPVDPETPCTTTGPAVGCTAPGPHRVAEVPAGGTFSTHISTAVRISLAAKPGAAAGDTGAITVAARADDGPTTTETYRVRLGEGVNLTAIDAQPRPVAPGGSAALRTGPRDSEYLCAPESVRLRPGQRLSFTFTVTADRGAGQGRGSVDFSLLDGEGVIDRNAGDNTAPITVGFDGEGGGLPITGSTPAAVASGGALLLLLGAAVVMALRRRLPD